MNVVGIGRLEATEAERTTTGVDVGGQVGSGLTVADHVDDRAVYGVDASIEMVTRFVRHLPSLPAEVRELRLTPRCWWR